MLARVLTCTLPTDLPIVKLQYTSAGVEVTNCVRRTCCYEYYIRLMQSGSVIPVSGTWRRARARQHQSCPWAFLSHYLYSVILSCPLCTDSLSFSLALFPFLPLFFFSTRSLSVSQRGPCTVFPSTSGWQGSLSLVLLLSAASKSPGLSYH